MLTRTLSRCMAASVMLLASCTHNFGKKLDAANAARLKSSTLALHGGSSPAGCQVVTMGQLVGAATLSLAAGVAVSGATGVDPGALGGTMAGTGAFAPKGTSTSGAKDPSAAIAAELGAALAKKYGMKIVSPKPSFTPSIKDSELAAAFPGVDFVLGVQSGFNATAYLRNPKRYRVDGGLQFALVDTKTGKAVMTGRYMSMPEYESNSPTYDELTKGDKPGLRRAIAQHQSKALAAFQEHVAKQP